MVAGAANMETLKAEDRYVPTAGIKVIDKVTLYLSLSDSHDWRAIDQSSPFMVNGPQSL